MSDAHGGGGGEGKFFFGVVAGLFILWVFGLYRTGDLFVPPLNNTESNEATVVESGEELPTESVRPVTTSAPRPRYNTADTQPPLPPGHPPLAEHGVTYYLDAEGNIIDVYRY